MADTLKTAGETTLEAMAREVEHCARGVNACDYHPVIAVVKSLRDLLDAEIKAMAAVDARAVALAHFERVVMTVDDSYNVVDNMRKSIERVDPTDPMEAFSDKEKWWPRNTMTGDEMLEFYYSRHPEKRPKSETRWPKSAIDFASRYTVLDA